MVILALLTAAASPPESVPAQARAPVLTQARASVRIVSAARVAAGRVPEEAIVTPVRVHADDGSQRTEQLVEFT